MKLNFRKGMAALLSCMLIVSTVFAGNYINAKAATDDITVDITAEHCTIFYRTSGESWSNDNKVTGTQQLKFDSDTVQGLEIKVMPDEGYQIAGSLSNEVPFTLEEFSKVPYSTTVDVSPWGGGHSISLLPGTTSIVITANESQDPPPPPPGGGEFDGNIYLFWSGKDGSYNYHHFTDLLGYNTMGEQYINYVKTTDVTADNNPGHAFDIDCKHEWVLVNVFENETVDGVVKDDSLLKRLFDGTLTEDELHSVTISPGITIEGKNSLTETPDNMFRITFLSEAYEGIGIEPIGEYEPELFNGFFSGETVDISDTTKDNPAEYMSFLLNDEIVISDLNLGGATTEVESIKALDVPSGAVTIQKNGDKFHVKFNSNFFDSVVFEVTTNGGTHYLKMARTAMKVSGDRGEAKVDFVYDNAHSYTEYELVATLVHKDGTTVVKMVEPSEVIDAMGNETGLLEIDGGTGVKQAQYKLAWDANDISYSYFTIIKSGSLSGSTYAGTVTGSGLGVCYDPEERVMIF